MLTNLNCLFRRLFREKQIFLISDTHFDHKNIIKYCHRPFESVETMNEILIRNWNEIVCSKDTVYFLGDLTFGRHHRPFDYWLKKLNGHLIMICGGHGNDPKCVYSKKIKYKGKHFFLVHRPHDIPKCWDGWAIHGHVHNHNMKDYPLVNQKKKTVNVSVELIGYRPVSLDKIIELIDSGRTIKKF